jgi:site-specific DNA-methyltransferase (adenine-specific)
MNELMNELNLMDCMEGMKQFPDKYFELAIVDPPYGIKKHKAQGLSKTNFKQWAGGEWDNARPSPEYFEELKRISKNQIIWGANYFVDYLDYGKKWIVWDKMLDQDQSHFELAYTSFIGAERIFRYSRSNLQGFRNPNRFHPTEKPIALYRWLLQNYAKPGDKILDTHSGSGSLACACHLEKFDFLAIEKDEDYYKSSCERLETLRSQGMLF